MPIVSDVFPLSADPDSGGSGGQLYEAACRVREALRGRAALLVVDRTDIVDAAEADGVLLSPKGAVGDVQDLTACHEGRMLDTAGCIPCSAWQHVIPGDSSTMFIIFKCVGDEVGGISQLSDGAKLLPSAGLPIGVARRLLQGGASLVGRVVSSPAEAASAATEGASVVLWQVSSLALQFLDPSVQPLVHTG